MTGWAALSSNPCIGFSFIRRWGSISNVWQTISANFSSIKPYLVAQVSTNVIELILFPSIHYILKGLLQNMFFGMNDEGTNRLFSSTLKGATLFLDRCYLC